MAIGATVPTPERFPELDALRGLAALIVVAHHCLLVRSATDGAAFHETGWIGLLSLPPLRGLWAGTEAVIFFFVLSGFVLSLGFLKGPVDTGAFLGRRVLRIWPPYAAALALAVAARVALGDGAVAGAGDWFHRVWSAPLDARLLLEHALLIGPLDDMALNPVIWSLAIEMQVALVFPWLMRAVSRASWPVAILCALGVHVAARAADAAFGGWSAWPVQWTLAAMLLYTFVVGALLARHRHALVRRARRLRGRCRTPLLLTVSFCLFQFHAFVPPALRDAAMRLAGFLPVTLGVSGIIVMSLASPGVSAWLRLGPLQWLGKVSYSLYLVHAIVLVAAVRLAAELPAPSWLPASLRAPSFWVAFACVSLVLAELGHRWVERPSIRLAHRLFSRPSERASERRVGAPRPQAGGEHRDADERRGRDAERGDELEPTVRPRQPGV